MSNSPEMKEAMTRAKDRLIKMPKWKFKLKMFFIGHGLFGHGFWYRSLLDSGMFDARENKEI